MRDEIENFPFFPDISEIDSFFGGHLTASVQRVIKQNLFGPASDILARPSKRFRASLVEIGFRLFANANEIDSDKVKAFELLGTAIEMIHSGSLVVDDIHDESRIRRGQTSLHLKYGLSTALNTGNWLYFWPLMIVDEFGFPKEKQNLLHKYIHKTLVLGHMGQALDTGIPMTEVPQEEVIAYCTTSMILKSGVLVSLALICGAIAAGASGVELDEFDQFGRKLGLALQMFDDIGNVAGETSSSTHELKKYEDLFLKRPSWVWATVAKYCDQPDYERFIEGVNLRTHDASPGSFIETRQIRTLGKQDAALALDSALSSFDYFNRCEGINSGQTMLEHLIGRLKLAYD